MIKLMNIICEIRLVSSKSLVAYKTSTSPKAYIVKMGPNENFYIYKHKNHVSLYPSFAHNSPKYHKIVDFLKSKHIPFEEINTGIGLKRFLKINPKFINFIQSPLQEIKLIPGNISPELVYTLTYKVRNKEGRKYNSYTRTVDIFDANNWYKDNSMGGVSLWDENSKNLMDWLLKLDKFRLNNIYEQLKKLDKFLDEK